MGSIDGYVFTTYVVPFNELQHPFSELFQEDGRQVSINYTAKCPIIIIIQLLIY